MITAGHPKAALALRDGYAVRSDATHDASSYAPAPLSPAPTRIDTGEAMPASADAVAPLDAVQMRGADRGAGRGRARRRRAAANADAAAGLQLRLPARGCGAIDVALLSTLGIERVRCASRACAWCAPARARSFAAPRP